MIMLAGIEFHMNIFKLFQENFHFGKDHLMAGRLPTNARPSQNKETQIPKRKGQLNIKDCEYVTARDIPQILLLLGGFFFIKIRMKNWEHFQKILLAL